jgi:hypothetical protein
MIPRELTKGMTMIEKIVVLLASHATPRELRHLRAFFLAYTPKPARRTAGRRFTNPPNPPARRTAVRQ